MDVAAMRTNNKMVQYSKHDPILSVPGCASLNLHMTSRYQASNIQPSHEAICKLPSSNLDSTQKVLLYKNQPIQQFIVQSLLGMGSFGHVLKCIDSVSYNNVAIKILNPDLCFTPSVSEIEFLKFLNDHDTENYFPKFYGDFTWKGYRCIVLELLGDNLYDYLRMNKFEGMTFFEVFQIAHQLCSALARLDLLGIIHCDIKPENIALSYSSHDRKIIKLIDFGSSCTHGGSYFKYVQSRFYRAIEVIFDAGYDKMIDTWSVSCVLIELLTGYPVFPGNDEKELVQYFIQTLGPIPDNIFLPSVKTSSLMSITKSQSKKLCSNYIPFSTPLTEKIFGSISVQKFLSQSQNKEGCRYLVLSFINMVSLMLLYDPKKRLTPGEAQLSHPFLKSNFNLISNSINHDTTFSTPLSHYHDNSLSFRFISDSNQKSIFVPTAQYIPVIQPIARPQQAFVTPVNQSAMPAYPRYIFNYGIPYSLSVINDTIGLYNPSVVQDSQGCNLVIPQSFLPVNDYSCPQCPFQAKFAYPTCSI